ncbi:hypothetical protein SAMN04489867_1424 [Pedococcus dokdonensis]|uniref:Uncharacterized protein n=1 Tax=Pedococcus dokdonensis TaxID=443156 RepID=A0A1H0PYS1_9MICO|nr:hypothetical protein [Pedococcus dokdonensis]SDP10327.1 hypothetical protein SAMN04489867_1424 [Pedococcus dokdonensis]
MTQPVVRLTRRAERQRVESLVEAQADARAALAVAAACVAVEAFLVLVPVGTELSLPVGVDLLWLLIGVVTVLALPLAAALAAFTSVRAVLVHGSDLPHGTARLHAATVVLAVAFFAWRAAGLFAG